jgi:hypothetical protein
MTSKAKDIHMLLISTSLIRRQAYSNRGKEMMSLISGFPDRRPSLTRGCPDVYSLTRLGPYHLHTTSPIAHQSAHLLRSYYKAWWTPVGQLVAHENSRRDLRYSNPISDHS